MRRFTFLFIFFLISCSYNIKIKTGDQAFDSKQYAIAQGLYRTEFDQATDQKQKAYYAFKLAQSYKYVSNFEQSLKWFKKAYELNYGFKALEEYAFALKNNGEYEAAIAAFQELIDEMKTINEYRKEINICKLNIQWRDQRNEFYYRLISLNSINQKSSDYSAVYDTSGNIYFVSDRLQETKSKNEKFNWTGAFYSDLFYFHGEGVSSLSTNINSPDNEGSFSFDSKMKKLYFTRCSNIGAAESYCNIFISRFERGNWSEAELIDFSFENSNQLHPAIYKNDSIMVFASNATGGIGQYDLYISYFIEDNWSRPENLGKIVNSPYDEKFPGWYNDTLYFSSNGHPGMGGLDVFKTYRTSDGSWVPPINVKPSINSEADDFGFFVDTSFIPNDSIYQKALLSSNRNQIENDEIYQVELRRRISTIPPKKPEKFKFEVIVNLKFVSHETYKNNIRTDIDSVDLIEKISRNTLNTKSASRISLKLLPGEKYTFLASKRNYLNKEFNFETPAEPALTSDSIYTMDIEVEMLALKYDEEFILQELYYDFDKWDIRPDARPALEKLKVLLITNPNIKILLGSHTDCRGDEKYNLTLSAKRAQSAMDWLINSNIAPARLKYIGYGEHDPSVNCKCENCSEVQHQLNRRTTFKIIRN